VASDLVEDLHPQLPVIAEILPNPCNAAEVLDVDAADTTPSCTSGTPATTRP
jgi:hypothetical protein